MADLPLIAWDEVPEGHRVWWLPFDAAPHVRWMAGRKLGGKLRSMGCEDEDPGSNYKFAAAEQQPGEWAFRLSIEREAHIDAEAVIQRLRDGLAALEQEMREWFKRKETPNHADISAWVNDIVAMRKGGA